MGGGWGGEARQWQPARLPDLGGDTQGHSSFWSDLGHVPDLLASPKRGSLWGHSWDVVAEMTMVRVCAGLVSGR